MSVSPAGDIKVSFAQADRTEHRVVVDARFRSAGNDANWWEEWWLEIGTAPNTDLVANLIEHRREDLLVAIREGLPRLQHVLTIWNDALPEGSPRSTRYFPVNWLRENIIYLAAWILINAAAITSMWLLRYRIPARRSLEGRCFACGYEIGVSGQTTCPECGKDVSDWMQPNPAEQNK